MVKKKAKRKVKKKAKKRVKKKVKRKAKKKTKKKAKKRVKKKAKKKVKRKAKKKSGVYLAMPASSVTKLSKAFDIINKGMRMANAAKKEFKKKTFRV
jgi:type III secretory pathway component EscR